MYVNCEFKKQSSPCKTKKIWVNIDVSCEYPFYSWKTYLSHPETSPVCRLTLKCQKTVDPRRVRRGVGVGVGWGRGEGT